MDAVINLKHEPALREKFEYARVVNNTVLIDRRTEWGNPFRVGDGQDRAQAIARYREDLWRRIREGELALEDLAGLDGLLARVLVPPRALPRRRARPRRRLGFRGAGRTAGGVRRHRALPSTAVPGRTAHGAVRGGNVLAACVLFHRAMRARYSNPPGPPVAALPPARPKKV